MRLLMAPDDSFRGTAPRPRAHASGGMRKFLVLLAAVLLTATASGCGDMCSNKPVATIPSPSGKTKAVVFHRTCGKTTDANTQVAVIPAYSDLANIPGNALILGGEANLQVRWVSDSSLSISGLGSAQVFKQQAQAADVAIAYTK